jgi:hypothetical protein
VDILRPDATALNAEFQMDKLMMNMEELAGAPRQAMGIRTPGEKTAFEVQALENAAGRIFQQKIQHFEENFIEPLLNQMLEAARRNIQGVEIVKATDQDFGLTEFLKVGPDQLNAKGKLRPVGARHFSRQAQVMQNLLGLVTSGLMQDPAVSVHMSGKKIAELAEEMLGLGKYDIVQENIRIAEQMETQSAATMAQQIDPEMLAVADRVIFEAEMAQQMNVEIERIGRTLEIITEHQIEEQSQPFKARMKQQVRRAVTTGVGYVKIGYQRAMKMDPEIERQHADVTEKLAKIR